MCSGTHLTAHNSFDTVSDDISRLKGETHTISAHWNSITHANSVEAESSETSFSHTCWPLKNKVKNWHHSRNNRMKAEWVPCFTSPERSIRCMLQGLPSNHTEQMPTWGKAIVSGVNPVAYNIAWEAPWLGGSVMMREYLFKISFSPSACMAIWLLWPIVECLLKLNENALLQQTIPTTRQKLEEIILIVDGKLRKLDGVVPRRDSFVRNGG